MGIFDFLKGTKKILGLIGYFNLEDWWLSEFTDAERKNILEKYQPLGFGGSSLIEGSILNTSQTVINLLSGMSGWFYKKEDRPIAYKIIEKAENLIYSKSDVLDIHFLYGAKIEISYKDRDYIQNGLEISINACKQQIFYSKEAAKYFLKKFKAKNLPGHKGFEQLAIIREKQKQYLEAINICEQAKSHGWSGNWEKRIERCRKKTNV